MHKIQNVIYLDMDGVLIDFDAHVVDVLGKSLKDFPSSQAGWDAMQDASPAMFSKMVPMADARKLVEYVCLFADAHDYGIGVLTAIPKLNRIPSATLHKKHSIQTHFPELEHNFNIGPYAEHKQFHANLGDILIDDNAENIVQWQMRGGIGIFHVDANTTIKCLEHIVEYKKEMKGNANEH